VHFTLLPFFARLPREKPPLLGLSRIASKPPSISLCENLRSFDPGQLWGNLRMVATHSFALNHQIAAR
jgi:hypothetical protein